MQKSECSLNMLKGQFGILGSQGKKLGSCDLTPFENGILKIRCEIGVLDFNFSELRGNFNILPCLKLGYWNLTLFEIGILGSHDPPFRDLL